MVTIIKVPAVFSCKLPSGEWINLALIRRLEYELKIEVPVAKITWDNGDHQIYVAENAIALVTAWEEAHKLTQERLPA
jgi:hypothetical protein